MTRVLLLITGMGRGGAERLLVAIARELDRSRFDPEVAYLLPEWDALVPELDRLGVPAHPLGGRRGPGWIVRLRRLVRERGIELVHVHSPFPAIGARLVLGVPQVYTEHNRWDSYHPATRWGNLLTYRRAGHVFAVSPSVARSARYPRLLRRLGMPPVEVLVHGHDPASVGSAQPDPRAALGVPDHAPVVGTVANLRPEKGHTHLLAAAEIVRQAVPDVRFVLVGEGPGEPAIAAEIRSRGLGGAVTMAGGRSDAAALCRAFDVFCLPSLSEGLPLAALEAMAAGVPVVATDAGGLPDLIEDGRNGLIVRRGDPVALAAAITRLLRDTALRTRLGDAGRERALSFDIRQAVRRMEAVYERTVAA